MTETELTGHEVERVGGVGDVTKIAKWTGAAWTALETGKGKKQTKVQARIEALETEVTSLKQEIKLLNDKLDSYMQQLGVWAITHI